MASPALADVVVGTPSRPARFAGPISVAARSGRTLYVGGAFDAVAPARNDVGSFVRLGPGGTPSPNSLRLDDTTLAMAEDGAGGLFVARFGVAKGVTVYTVIHQLADGSIAPTFLPTFNNRVTAIARVGSVVYVGGTFTQANGSTRGRGAAFDLATGTLLPWDPHVNSSVGIAAIAAGSPGSVYIGGAFVDVAGVAAIGLVRLNATTGAIDALIDAGLAPVGGAVTRLLTVNGTMYVVGIFNTIAGAYRPALAAIDLATQATTAFVLDTRVGVVNDIAFIGGRLFAGAAFRLVNGVPRTALVELDPTTGALRATPFQVTEVTALAASGTTLYVAGPFTSLNGAVRVHLAALDVSGGVPVVLPWNPGLTDPRPKALAVAGGDVAVFGTDMAFGAQVRSGLAALDLVTGEVLPFAPRLDGGVVAMTATPSSVYLAGGFSSVNGVPRNRVAAVDPHGVLLPWNTGVISDVALMRAVGADVLLGLSSDVALVDGVTGAARPWRVHTNGTLRALREVGGTVYVAGDFSFAVDASGSVKSRSGLAAIDLASAVVQPFAPAVTGGRVLDIDVRGPLLYLVGEFTSVGGQARAAVAAVDRTSGVVAPFAPVTDGMVQRVSVGGGAVYLGGPFSVVNGLARSSVAAVAEGTGGTTLAFNPVVRPSGSWVALDAYPDALTAVSQTDGRVNVWPDDAPGGVPAPPGPPRAVATGATLTVDWPVPLVGARPASYVLDAAAAPGAPAFASIPVTGTTFTIGGVPPGLYYLSVRGVTAAGSGASSRQVGVVVGASTCGEPPTTPALAASATGGLATLQWPPATGVATSYTLLVGTAPGASDIGAVPMGAATAFTSPAPPGVYYLRLASVGPCGASGFSPDVRLVVDVAPPPAPPEVAVRVTGNTVAIGWTAVPGALGYRFEAGSGPLLRDIVSVSTPATSLVAGGVPPGTYYVRVIAVGATGESLRPDEVAVIVR